MRNIKKHIGVLFVIFLFISCSQNNPKITEGYIGLCYYNNSGRTEERYYVFVVPSDDDGIEDIEEMYISHEKEGLEWKLATADWISIDAAGKTWIGTHNLAMMDGEKLPRGVFKIELIDKAGMTGTTQVTFDVRDSKYSFPKFSIENGRYTIVSEYPVNYFLCYNESGAFIRTIQLEHTEGEITSLSLPRDARTVALWAEAPDMFISALTEMAAVR